MKALQSLTLIVLLSLALAGPGSLLADAAQAADETLTKDSRSAAFVYANKILKRRLQSDHRLGAEPDNEKDKAVVYGSLPFEDSELHIIAGHFQSMGREVPEEEPSRPPKGQDPNIAATRRAAELMVEGGANEVVLDELGAPPWAEGEGSVLGKVKPEAAWLAESFDLAMAGNINKATAKLQDNWKVLGKNSRAINNLACLKALAGDSEGALKVLVESSESAITDFNVTAGLAALAIVTYLASGVKVHGHHYVGLFFWKPIAPLEWLDLVVRPATLALRLLLVITADEMLRSAFLEMCPVLLPSAVMAFEVFIALVQAFVFTLLTSIYVGAAVAEHH